MNKNQIVSKLIGNLLYVQIEGEHIVVADLGGNCPTKYVNKRSM